MTVEILLCWSSWEPELPSVVRQESFVCCDEIAIAKEAI